MKRSRFSEEQITGILREVQRGGNTQAVCAAHNISEGAYYARKRKYGGMDVSEARRLRVISFPTLGSCSETPEKVQN